AVAAREAVRVRAARRAAHASVLVAAPGLRAEPAAALLGAGDAAATTHVQRGVADAGAVIAEAAALRRVARLRALVAERRRATRLAVAAALTAAAAAEDETARRAGAAALHRVEVAAERCWRDRRKRRGHVDR